jgi:hypothetical protein
VFSAASFSEEGRALQEGMRIDPEIPDAAP